MQQKSDHINYTAADIQRYINKQMTPAEMHAFEKASLEDPFLAEALEGYINTPVSSIPGDIDELKKRLHTKDEPARIVPLYKKIRWSAAAAILILMGMAATWLWLKPSADNKIAQQKAKEQQIIKEQETPPAPALNDKDAVQSQESISNADAEQQKSKAPVPSPATIAKPEEKQKLKEKPAADKKDNAADIASIESKSIPAPETEQAIKKTDQRADDKQKARAFVSRTNDMAANKNAAPSIPAYIFKGKITDDQQKPLPFVNISVPDAGTYTYSDANGNFTLMNGDSQIVVRVKSVGFKPENFTLYNNTSSNNISLKTEQHDLSEVVVAGYGTQRKQAKKTNKKETDDEIEAEPADGWGNYDIYLLNNERGMQQGYSKIRGSVELSFIVNRYGNTSDFNIERSTCPSCEKEAVRLIKEGPKWKLTKGTEPARITVTLEF